MHSCSWRGFPRPPVAGWRGHSAPGAPPLASRRMPCACRSTWTLQTPRRRAGCRASGWSQWGKGPAGPPPGAERSTNTRFYLGMTFDGGAPGTSAHVCALVLRRDNRDAVPVRVRRWCCVVTKHRDGPRLARLGVHPLGQRGAIAVADADRASQPPPMIPRFPWFRRPCSGQRRRYLGLSRLPAADRLGP